MGYDAFISYRRDCGFFIAQTLKSLLKARNIDCFLDLEEERPGRFDESLVEAIQNSRYFLLVLTENTLNRCVNRDDWVRREIEAAVACGAQIIPVRYNFHWPEHLNGELPETIRGLDYIQSVPLVQEYITATVDRIINYMAGLDIITNEQGTRVKRFTPAVDSRFINTEAHFREKLQFGDVERWTWRFIPGPNGTPMMICWICCMPWPTRG